MGYIKHEVAIAIFFDRDSKGIEEIEALKEKLTRPETYIDGEPLSHYGDIILGPYTGVNGYTTYVFVPDGSKEGWEHSDIMAGYRQEFVGIASSSEYADVVLLQMGGDDSLTKVLFTTDRQEVKGSLGFD
jgi:hypothetical protein